MSKRNWILVLALAALVLVWPVAGAVSAADTGGGDDALASIAQPFDGDNNPGNGEGEQPDAPGLSVAENASDDAPGQSGDAPGKSGEAPGHDKSDEAGDGLVMGVVDGTLAPGETVTIELTDGNETVDGVNVTVNDEPAGSTDENGTLSFTLPNDEEVEIEAEHGDAESEFEFEFESEDEESEEDEQEADEESEDEESEEDEQEADEESEDEESEEDEEKADEDDDNDTEGGNGNGPQ
jgi:hypothetical protein